MSRSRPGIPSSSARREEKCYTRWGKGRTRKRKKHHEYINNKFQNVRRKNFAHPSVLLNSETDERSTLEKALLDPFFVWVASDEQQWGGKKELESFRRPARQLHATTRPIPIADHKIFDKAFELWSFLDGGTSFFPPRLTKDKRRGQRGRTNLGNWVSIIFVFEAAKDFWAIWDNFEGFLSILKDDMTNAALWFPRRLPWMIQLCCPLRRRLTWLMWLCGDDCGRTIRKISSRKGLDGPGRLGNVNLPRQAHHERMRRV